MTDVVKCSGKHTKYQPTRAEWKCPACGSGDNFSIDEIAVGAHPDCPLLHVHDLIVCFDRDCSNDGGITGGRFAARLQKLRALVPCAHCKGTGLVKKAAKK